MRILFILLVGFTLSSFIIQSGNEKKRVLLIRIDEIGIVTDGVDTISSDELADYISKRLFKSYMGSGKMYDMIKVELIHLGPMPIVLEPLLKEIALGQKKALPDFCLHKYKKGFDTLTAKQQKKIRKAFPVLFQSEY